MNTIATIVLSSHRSPRSVSPTHDLRPEVGRHRRCAYAYSAHTKNSS